MLVKSWKTCRNEENTVLHLQYYQSLDRIRYLDISFFLTAKCLSSSILQILPLVARRRLKSKMTRNCKFLVLFFILSVLFLWLVDFLTFGHLFDLLTFKTFISVSISGGPSTINVYPKKCLEMPWERYGDVEWQCFVVFNVFKWF